MLISPDLLTRAVECQERIGLNRSFDLGVAPLVVPVKKIRVRRWELIRLRSYLSVTLCVVAITNAKQAAMFGPCLVEHSIIIRVGRTVGDTMLENVKVDPRTTLVGQS